MADPHHAVKLRAKNLLRESAILLRRPTVATKPHDVVATALRTVLQTAVETGVADNVALLEAIAQAHAFLIDAVVPRTLHAEVVAAHVKGLKARLGYEDPA